MANKKEIPRIVKPAYTLFLRTGAACNVGCISCPAGRREEQPGSLMQPELLDRAIQRIYDQDCTVISATFHFYNDPCMHPRMAELIQVAQKYGIPGLISSNLTSKRGALWPNAERIIATGIENFIISVSGWTQPIYERSHQYGDIEELKSNMQRLAQIKHKRTFVRVSWHDYEYNRHEQAKMREYAQSLGFTFTPYNTGLLPLEEVLKKFHWLDSQVAVFNGTYMSKSDPPRWHVYEPHPGERDLITKLPEAYQLCMERRDYTCINQGRMITLHSDGTLQPCCVKNVDEGRHADIFTVDLEQWNHDRKSDPACIKCQSVGGHVYAMQRYRRPKTWRYAVYHWVEDLWRKWNLGGLFRWGPKLFSKRSYIRPRK